MGMAKKKNIHVDLYTQQSNSFQGSLTSGSSQRVVSLLLLPFTSTSTVEAKGPRVRKKKNRTFIFLFPLTMTLLIRFLAMSRSLLDVKQRTRVQETIGAISFF